MKRFISVLMAMVLVFGLATTTFAATVTPELSSDSVQAGKDVTVVVKLDEAMTGITNFEYRLYFNPELFVLKSSENGSANTGTTLTAKTKTDKNGTYYGISFLDTTSEGQNINAGTIYTLVFTALEDISEEQAATFKLTQKFMVGENDQDIEDGTVVNGEASITVKLPAETYDIVIPEDIQNGTVRADKTEAEAGETVTLTVTPDTGYELDALTVMSGETTVEMTENKFTMPASDVTVSATFKKLTTGYRFATSADTSANADEEVVVSVKITGHSNPEITTYNAYDLTLTYDNTKLQYLRGVGAAQGDQVDIKEKGNNQIQIVGVGDAKGFGVEVAKLTFKIIGQGTANVTVEKAQISEKKETVSADIPEATPQHKADDPTPDTTPDQSVILIPYTVTKETFIVGEQTVLHGEAYTFSFADTNNYTYQNLIVKVNDESVTPTLDNGVYTIENVTGAVVITATRTPNSYAVTIKNDDGANVEAPATATYGTEYTFKVTATEGKEIKSVTVTKTADANESVDYSLDNDVYKIAGTDITANFTITVTQGDKAPTHTTITFEGVEDKEVVGGLSQTAPIGQTFNFSLNKEAGYSYTAKVGDTVLMETTATEQTPAFYTIPAELVVAEGVTVTITKTAISTLKVEVSQYFNADGSVMFLVIAKDGDKVLSYGEAPMFWSSKYSFKDEQETGVYCWLISSTDTLENVKTAAEAAIKPAAEDTSAPFVAYDCDVNQTGKVDVNDAQLAYDMYKGAYSITENLTMDKFLEADVTPDKVLDTRDVAAIINEIINPTLQS